MSDKVFEAIFQEAHRAGMTALAQKTPTPMVVGSAIGMTNKIDTTKPVYYESEGMCGFAWVNIKPGTSKFARYLKRKGYAKTDSYYGGVTVWVSEGGQSIERKEAYAYAFASFLREEGIKASANSRLD